MEQRVAVLEANIDHIRSDIHEMKDDIRRLDTKIDGVKDFLHGQIQGVGDSLATLDRRLSKQLFWMVGLVTTVAIALLGLMTGGFMWLADKIAR